MLLAAAVNICCTVQMMMMICRLFVCPLFCEKLFWFFFKKCRRKTFCWFVCLSSAMEYNFFFSRYIFWPFNLAFSDSNMHLDVDVCAFLSLWCLLKKVFCSLNSRSDAGFFGHFLKWAQTTNKFDCCYTITACYCYRCATTDTAVALLIIICNQE